MPQKIHSLLFRFAENGNGEMVSAFAKATADSAKLIFERSRTVRAHRVAGDSNGRVNPTACKTKYAGWNLLSA